MAGQANGAGTGSARNRSYPAARHGGRGEAESGAAQSGRQETNESLAAGEIDNNRLILGTPSDWSSERSSNTAEMRDEIDMAIQKCLEDQSSLKKLRIMKVSKG